MRIALSCFIIHWSIILVSTDIKLLTIAGENLKKEVVYTIGDKEKFTLKCETNLKVKFSWKVCLSFNDDVWSQTSSYITCEDMFKNQSNFCIDIEPGNTEQHYYYADNRETSNSSKLVLLNDPNDPHEGCIICTAIHPNQTVSYLTRYYFHDKCGTPTHQAAAAHKYQLCRGKQSGYNLTKDKDQCFSNKPENLEVIQNLTERGLLHIFVKWKDPKMPKLRSIYGYNLTGIKHSSDGHPIYGNICYITRKYGMPFNEQKKLLKNISLDIEEINDEAVYIANLSVLFQPTFQSDAEYEISVEVLPLSDPAIIRFKESSMEDLCHNYYELNKVLPSFCYMVTNIVISKCFPDKSITVSWKIPSNMNFENLMDMTYISLDGDTHEEIHEIKMEQKSFTFVNVISKSYGEIYLKFKNGNNSYPQTFTLDCSGISKHGLKETVRIVIAVGLLFVLCLCLSCGIKFKRDFCSLIKKLRAYEDRNLLMTVFSSNNEPLIIQTNKNLMIIYPDGCIVVQKLVLGLAAIMNFKGFKVLVDVLQTQRVADEGLENVLSSDFKKADYVVIFCTEPEDTSLEHHSTYKFMLNMLINQYSNGNSKQYIAVYFNDSKDYVPLYLHHKSYSFPSSFDAFLRNLHGIPSQLGTLLEGSEMVKFKKLFYSLCTKMKDQEHKGCRASLCRKASLKVSSNSINSLEGYFNTSSDESEDHISLDEFQTIFNS